MRKICPKCFAILEEAISGGFTGHYEWCDDTVERLKEMFGFDKLEKEE